METRARILSDYRTQRNQPGSVTAAATRWLCAGYPLEELKPFIAGLTESVTIAAQQACVASAMLQEG